MTTKTLVQRIHDLCVAIGNDLKSIKTAVDKNTAVNDDQDKNIKVILEDPDRVKITDFYHYDTAKQESYLASGMTSLRLYHDKVYRLYFQDETVAQRSQPKNTTAIIFKLNHNNGGVIQLHSEIANKIAGATTSRSLRYYPCTVAKDKTLTPIPVFNAEKHLYFIPIGESEFAIAFENYINRYDYDFRAVDFILNGQNYEIYLSKHNLPYQFSKTNQPKPDYGIIQSLDNSNLIRNSVGNLGKENFSQFNTNPINFGRAEFYTRDSWAVKPLDDYYYWDKNAKSYDIQMTLSQTHSAYTKTYAYIVPYDPDGLRMYAHTITERSEDILLPESTPTRLVISDEYGSGLVNYFKTIGNTKFALIIPGCRFIEEKTGKLNITDRHLCGAQFHPQVSQAIIAKDLVQGQHVKYTIVDDTTVTIELLNGLSIPEPILELMQYGFSVTKHDTAYCYYLPEVRNTSVPEPPTTYNASISTIYPYPNNDPNYVFNKIFKNYAHYFKIGFLINRFSGAPLPLEEYIEDTGEPLQFTIHSMKMSVNYS